MKTKSTSKKLLALLISVLMVLCVMPMTAFAENLEKPTNLRWEGNIAKWDAVPGAAKYRVLLYEATDRSDQNLAGGGVVAENEDITNTQFDFNAYLISGMHYRFQVAAFDADDNFSGFEYSSIKSMPGTIPTVSGFNWNGNILSWTAVPNAAGYIITVKKDNAMVGLHDHTATPTYDISGFLERFSSGSYTVEVKACRLPGNNTFLNQIAKGETDAKIFYTIDLEKIEITTPPNRTVYVVGENFNDAGMVVTAYYSNNTSAVVEGFGLSDFYNLQAETTSITVIHSKGGITKTATQPITVKTISDITVVTPPTKISYTAGESFDTTGMVVKVNYLDGSSDVITDYEVLDGYNLAEEKASVTLEYTRGSATKTTTQPISVSAAPKPTNLRWDGKVAKWNAVPNATEYLVNLLRDDESISTARVYTNEADFSYSFYSSGAYQFTVYAVVNGTITETVSSPTFNFVMSYKIKIDNGKAFVLGSEVTEAAAGTTVTITANPPASGQVFDKWKVLQGGSDLLNNTRNATTTFTMPNEDVCIGAYYKDKDALEQECDIVIHYGKASIGVGAEITAASAGEIVTITANSPASGQEFDKWVAASDSNVTFADETDAITTFTMPANAVEITAIYKAHVHSWSTEWTNNDTHHWHDCTGCEEKQGFAAHTPDYEEATEEHGIICTECGYIIEPALGHTHNFATEYSKNASGHWYACTGCEEKQGFAAHTPDYEEATEEHGIICTECGYVIAEAIGVIPTIKINNNPGTKTINYGEGIKFTATATDMPEGAVIKWYVNGAEKGAGKEFTFSDAKADATITVKIVDKDGNVMKDATDGEISASEKVTVKAGFFQKLISFFKNLFKANRIIAQSIDSKKVIAK